MNKDYKEVYSKFTASGNHTEENFINFCSDLKHVYYLQVILFVNNLRCTRVSRQVFLKNIDISSDVPIPAPFVISSDTPTNRKKKEKGYETLATAVSVIADPVYNQHQLQMMASVGKMSIQKKLKQEVMHRK